MKEGERKIAGMMKAIQNDLFTQPMKIEMEGLEAQKQKLHGLLNQPVSMPPTKLLSMPDLPDLFRRKVSALERLTNAHYHADREAFLDSVHRWFMFVVITLGAGALLDTLPRLAAGAVGWRELSSLAAAVIAALDLTFDLSNRARDHALMRRRYHELRADVIEGVKTLHQAQVCLDRFSADEEPSYRVVFLASWNLAQESVYGDETEQYTISGAARFFRHLARRSTAEFKLKKPKQISV